MIAYRLALIVLLVVGSTMAAGAADLNIYGPGGPAPAVKEAAAVFAKLENKEVTVTAGPTQQWRQSALNDADLIYSGSETMMHDFVSMFDGRLKSEDVYPLYLRPSAILVRPSNPEKIGGITDLLKPGHRILVVNGAGQNGLWEDIAGRLGSIESVRALRSNIAVVATNSAEAKKAWSSDQTLDAWIIWNIWQREAPELADVVEVEPDYRIYRDTGIAPTERGKGNPLSAKFVEFLKSKEGADIFAKWGWMTR